jgi:hypothetical protein
MCDRPADDASPALGARDGPEKGGRPAPADTASGRDGRKPAVSRPKRKNLGDTSISNAS